MEFKTNKPIYQQIVDFCFSKILTREWRAEERVVSVRELSTQLAVNSRTVMKAYEYLQAEDIIYPERGMGFYLAKDAVKKVMKIQKKEFFDKRSDVKILAEDIANWNKDEAMQLMEDWVQAYGKIDAVISMNDNMAAGAIEAVKDNAKYKNMQAYGVDGTAEACLLIKEGKMTSTGLQSAIDLAKMNTEAMHDVLTGKKKVTDINENVPAPLITSDNVDEYIQMYKDNGQIKK